MKKKKKRTKGEKLFTIGYDGPVAVVDGVATKNYGSLSIEKLIEIGLFRAATALALYEDNKEHLDLVASEYNKISNSNYSTGEIARLFGVATSSVDKVLVL